ncbi:MAG: ABC transporter substrate-binding protein [Clostridia bacterium]|nr:ABC transporter substrate-binding protein [Clostridia bacterium]
MKKNLPFILIAILLLSVAFTGCNKNNQSGETNNPTMSSIPSNTPTKEVTTAVIAGLKGPTSMGMIRMFAEVNSLSEFVKVEFNVYSAPDVITAGLLNGEIDIAAIPTNLAATLYNKTEGDIVLLGVNTLGVLNILTSDKVSITSMADLKGKKIIASGKGSTPEYILNYLLEMNGLDPSKDVEIEYKTEHSEVASMILSGEADIVLLPQPFVTTVIMQNPTIKNAVDMTEEWNKAAGDDSTLMMGCLVTTREFAEKYESELVSLMILNLESAEWVNQYPSDAAPFIVQYDVLPSVEVAEKAIPDSNITFIFAQKAKDQLNGFFKILYDYNPQSIGGELPKDDFYFGQ